MTSLSLEVRYDPWLCINPRAAHRRGTGVGAECRWHVSAHDPARVGAVAGPALSAAAGAARPRAGQCGAAVLPRLCAGIDGLSPAGGTQTDREVARRQEPAA